MSETTMLRWAPGSWQADGPCSVVLTVDGRYRARLTPSEWVADARREERRSAVALLLAAPDLYAALWDLVDGIDRLGPVHTERMERTRTALRRARGEE